MTHKRRIVVLVGVTRMTIDNNQPFQVRFAESEEGEAIFFEQPGQLHNVLTNARTIAIEVPFSPCANMHENVFTFTAWR